MKAKDINAPSDQYECTSRKGTAERKAEESTNEAGEN
jgi:hypothetical protein